MWASVKANVTGWDSKKNTACRLRWGRAPADNVMISPSITLIGFAPLRLVILDILVYLFWEMNPTNRKPLPLYSAFLFGALVWEKSSIKSLVVTRLLNVFLIGIAKVLHWPTSCLHMASKKLSSWWIWFLLQNCEGWTMQLLWFLHIQTFPTWSKRFRGGCAAKCWGQRGR